MAALAAASSVVTVKPANRSARFRPWALRSSCARGAVAFVGDFQTSSRPEPSRRKACGDCGECGLVQYGGSNGSDDGLAISRCGLGGEVSAEEVASWDRSTQEKKDINRAQQW